jgi:hypothetical protein
MTVAGMKAFEEATGQTKLVEKAKAEWIHAEITSGQSEADAKQSWMKTPGMTECAP